MEIVRRVRGDIKHSDIKRIAVVHLAIAIRHSGFRCEDLGAVVRSDLHEPDDQFR
jgi:hypothetical protein